MNAIDQARQQAQDLLAHIDQLIPDVSNAATADEAVERLTSVVALLNGTEEREKQRTPKRRRRRLNERRLETKLVILFDDLFSRRSGGWAESFEDAGVLTGNRGVVISVGTGQEFQLTIVESKRR
jgi:hypothetical protein